MTARSDAAVRRWPFPALIGCMVRLAIGGAASHGHRHRHILAPAAASAAP